VGVHIATADWYAVVPFVKEQLPNRPHDVLFQILARACMELAVESLDSNLPVEEKLAFVFEENDFSNVILKDTNRSSGIIPFRNVLAVSRSLAKRT